MISSGHKNLQFRTDAQVKYLQSVLLKAHEALAGYNYSSIVGVEHSNVIFFSVLHIFSHPNSIFLLHQSWLIFVILQIRDIS